MKNFWLLLVIYNLLFISSSFVVAKELPDVPSQQFDFLNKLNKQQPFIPSPKNTIPNLQLPPLQESTNNQLSNQLSIQIDKFELLGNTIFSNEQLAEIIQPYEGKLISSSDLFNLRNVLNLFYINNGYINSGVIIPDQDISNGIIKINIIEGSLNKITVTGNGWLDQDYITDRLRLDNEQILNLKTLQDKIKIFHQNRLINHINAELLPGKKLGESELKVQVEENLPYQLNIAFNNLKNPSVGELQGVIYGEFINLTGRGDSLSAHFSLTEGLDNEGVSYSIPVSAYDTKIFAFYEHTHAKVIEEPFTSNAIKSNISSYGLGIEQPYHFSPNRKLVASMLFERKTSQTHAFSRPFSFSHGPIDGKSRVSALRVSGEWVDQQASYVLAMRSTFSVGLNTLDATQHNNHLPDGQYFAWLGQFQWVQRLADTGIKLLFRSDLQLTPDSLLPMEKISVGGYYSVRGYRENQLVRDNGWVSSIEARFPLFKLSFLGSHTKQENGNLELAVFYDFGWSENTEQFTPDTRASTLSSVGVGLRWNPHDRIHSELYWGYGLRNVNNRGEDSLQDNGVQFILDIKLF